MRQRDKYDLSQFPTDTITVTEAARMMRVGTGKVRALLESGELHGGKFRSYWRVNRALLYQYMLDHTQGE